MKGKKGYIISYADWFKGFFIGVLVGAVIVYLIMSGMVKLPIGAKEATIGLALLI